MTEKIVAVFAIIGLVAIAALSICGLVWILDAISEKTKRE